MILSGVEALRQAITRASAPIERGADTLTERVGEVIDEVDALISQIDTIVSTLIGAVDQVPVSALPEPMAKPAVSTLQQLASQFSAQLTSAARAASSQLDAVSSQVSQAIKTGQDTLAQTLETALQGALETTSRLTQNLEVARCEAKQLSAAAIETLKTTRDTLLADFKQQLGQLDAQAQRPLDEICDAVTALVNTETKAVTQLFDQCTSVVTSAESQLTAAKQEATTLEQAITQLQQQILAHFAQLQGRLTARI